MPKSACAWQVRSSSHTAAFYCHPFQSWHHNSTEDQWRKHSSAVTSVCPTLLFSISVVTLFLCALFLCVLG